MLAHLKKLDLKRYSYIESKQIWISMIKKDTQLFGSLGSQKILLDIRYLKKALGLLKWHFQLTFCKSLDQDPSKLCSKGE